jgi:hypothetical protein
MESSIFMENKNTGIVLLYRYPRAPIDSLLARYARIARAVQKRRQVYTELA